MSSVLAEGTARQRTVAPGPTPTSLRERHLEVVPPHPWRAPRAPFLLLVLTLLVGGLVTLLLLNTALGRGAFVVHDLEQRSGQLADREQGLQQQVALEASPARLAQRARRLGMVPSENPVFLRTSDGRVLGVPRPATAPPKPSPSASPSLSPSASPSPSPSPSLSRKESPNPSPGPSRTASR
jgi:hypothetical protein